MLRSSFVFLVALSIGLNGFAANTVDISKESIQQHFDSYMIQNISSEDYANELVGNPTTFEATVKVIKDYIKSKDTSYNDLQKARILILDKAVERAVSSHNAKLATQKRMARAAGATVGAAIGGAFGAYKANQGNRPSGDFTMGLQPLIVLAFTGLGIGAGGLAGYVAGNVANAFQGTTLNPQDLVEEK